MMLELQAFWPRAQKQLKAALLAMAGLTAFYVSVVAPMRRDRLMTEMQATGLAAMGSERYEESTDQTKVALGGFIGAVPGGVGTMRALPAVDPAVTDRKQVTTDSFELVVSDPAGACDQVRQLALASGGYLVTSQVNGLGGTASSSLTVRVPVAAFEKVRDGIRKLGLRIESDRLEAQDVTKSYVDQQSGLRNLRAEEQQYLQILKRAATVKDTLQVSDKLNEVRGEIEQQQVEFDTLSKQVETVAITVALRAEAQTQVLGMHWKPIYRLKAALNEGLDGLGDYAASMASFLFLLPTMLLWALTLVAGAAIGWRALRWAARVFFHIPKAAKAVS